jgi:hypothetical protein
MTWTSFGFLLILSILSKYRGHLVSIQSDKTSVFVHDKRSAEYNNELRKERGNDFRRPCGTALDSTG